MKNLNLQDAGQRADWTQRLQQAVEDARPKNPAQNPDWLKQVAVEIAPMVAQLTGVEDRTALFLEAVPQHDLVGLVAALHGKSEVDVRRNLAFELLAIGSAPRAEDAPSPVELSPVALKGCNGRVLLGACMPGAGIEQIPADFVLIPQHRSKASGGTGGVALAFKNRLDELEQKLGGAFPEARFALGAFERERGEDVFRPGRAIASWTAVGNPTLFPELVIKVASVPNPDLRPRPAYPSAEAEEAHYQARVEYTRDVVDCAFDAIEDELRRSKTKAGRLVLPVLLTGPQGALGETVESYAMAGKIIGDRLRRFYGKPELQGIEVVIALFNNDPLTHGAKERALRLALESGEVPAGMPKQNVRALDAVFQELAEGQDALKQGGKTLDADLVAKAYGGVQTGFVGSFLDRIGRLSDAQLADRHDAVATLVNPLDAELFWQIHKHLELPELNGGKASDPPMRVTRERIAAFLSDPQRAKQISGVLLNQLKHVANKPGAYGGEEKLPDLLSAGLAAMLQKERWRHLEDGHRQLRAELDPKEQEIKALKDQLGAAIDPAALEQLQAKYETALGQLRAKDHESQEWRDAATKFQKQSMALTGDNQELQRLVASLQRRIAEKETTISAYQSRPAATQYSSYSR